MKKESEEKKYAKLLLGQNEASILMTDGYKFAMAQAGFPLREETFVFSLRKGGPFFIPFDFAEVIRYILPQMITKGESDYLESVGYGLTPAMTIARGISPKVVCAPQGSWVLAGEPILTVTGPSFLVSWLEPLVLMFHYPIQIATTLTLNSNEVFLASCIDEVGILECVNCRVNALTKRSNDLPASWNEYAYCSRVSANILACIQALGVDTRHSIEASRDDASRAIEVGLRAATCMAQHLIVLEEMKKWGVLKTSNVFGACKLQMIPVGTTGHEHQERWGRDEEGFRAIRDMRPNPPSYLFDTYDPVHKGIPSAFNVISEDLQRPCSMRFDSGDQDEQLKMIIQRANYWHADNLSLIFEDGYTAEKTEANEKLCDELGWPRKRRFYGYGGFWVSQPHATPYSRDEVSAAYKLCWSSGPVRKFSGTKGKGSLAGKPIIMRRIQKDYDRVLKQGPSGGVLLPDSIVAQEGEMIEGYLPLNAKNMEVLIQVPRHTDLSEETKRIHRELEEKYCNCI